MARLVRTALDLASLPHTEPSPWLDEAARLGAQAPFPGRAVTIFICDPFIRARKWRVIDFGFAGRVGGRAERSLRATAKRHWPHDDVLPRLSSNSGEGVAPSCASRRDLVKSREWNASRLREARSKMGLHEFVRAVEPLADMTALVLQVDGLSVSWKPAPADVESVACLAHAAARGFGARFIEPTQRRRRLLEALTVAQRSVVEPLASGQPERVIANRIGKSTHTVHEHAKEIYRIWEISSRYELRDKWLGADALPGYERPKR